MSGYGFQHETELNTFVIDGNVLLPCCMVELLWVSLPRGVPQCESWNSPSYTIVPRIVSA